MSKITVTTIAGQTSGSDANKVKIESGDELNVVNGDLTVNTDTLFADASADKVGVNTTAMDASLEVNSASSKINTLTVKTAAGSGGVAGIGFMAGQTTAGREKAAIFFKETNGGAHYTGDIVFAVASSSGNATQVAASDEVCRITPNGLAIGGTGAANTLDDYEEGTWTPTVQNATGYSSQFGRYFKVGHLCFLNANVTTTGASGSTNEIRGLPFTSASTGNSAGNLSIGYYSGVNTPMVWLSGYVINNSNIIYITGNAAGHTGETIQYNGAQMFKGSGNSRIMFSVVYHVA